MSEEIKMDETFIRDQSTKSGACDVPEYMLHSNRNDAGFFFGTKECKKIKPDNPGEIVPVVPIKVDTFNDTEDTRISSIVETVKPYKPKTTETCFVGKPYYRGGKEYDGHILVVGGAGSGKSSCIAMPTLETWNGTFFAIDIKGELTAHWDRIENKNRPAKIFNLTTERGLFSTYDPFYFLQHDEDNLVQNIREIAHSIIPLPTDTKEPFWIQSARHILTAVLLYGYKNEKRKSFLACLYLILTKPIWELIDEIYESKIREAQLHITQLHGLKNSSDNKMLTGISAQLNNDVMVFVTDPRILDELTPTEDTIKWEDLETHNIFMRISEDKLGQWDSVISMMLTQMIRSLERRKDKLHTPEGEPIILSAQGEVIPPTLLLLDEFPRLGKVDVIQNATATLRSKGVTICLLMQSLTQLDLIYGKETRQIIVDNCPYKAILSVTDPENQRTFSDMIGDIRVATRSVGENQGAGTSRTDDESGSSESCGASRGITETWEPVIRPHEFATLKDIVLMTPEGYCRVDKAPYYMDLAKVPEEISEQKTNEGKSNKGFVMPDPPKSNASNNPVAYLQRIKNPENS